MNAHDIIAKESVSQVCENIRNGWAGLFVLLGFVWYIADIERLNVQIWSVVGALVAVGHGILVHVFLHQHSKNNIKSYLRWGWGIALYSLLAGATISIGACLAFNQQSIGWGYFLVALMIMPGFGSAVTSASFLPIHISWILGMNVPFGLFLMMQNNEMFFAMGLLLLFAAIPMMVILGLGYARMYKRNIALHLKNIALMDELTQKAADATRANQDKSRFLAAASHDLRQPHQALGLFIESLDYMEHEPKKKEILGKTKQAFQAMNNLLDQLLDISKLDAGTMKPDMQAIKLQPLLHRLVMAYMVQVDQKGIELRLRPTDAVVHADPTMLNRILSNLLSNAIHHTKRGGILLAVCQRGEAWRIDLWDTGCGIPSDKFEDVFQEFTQLENPERDREKGLGLGLSIVQRLAHIMGTDISLRSQVGKGSRFSITLASAHDANPINEETSLTTMDIASLQSLTIVLIDDDKLAREGLQMLLNVWGCDVLTFGSQEDCLHSLKYSKRCPDVLIVDYRLREEKTGAEAIAAVCQLLGQTIPSLIITGDTAPERIEEAKKGGFPLLHKPVNPDALKAFLLKNSTRC